PGRLGASIQHAHGRAAHLETTIARRTRADAFPLEFAANYEPAQTGRALPRRQSRFSPDRSSGALRGHQSRLIAERAGEDASGRERRGSLWSRLFIGGIAGARWHSMGRD